jgi:hypothetical protein
VTSVKNLVSWANVVFGVAAEAAGAGTQTVVAPSTTVTTTHETEEIQRVLCPTAL